MDVCSPNDGRSNPGLNPNHCSKRIKRSLLCMLRWGRELPRLVLEQFLKSFLLQMASCQGLETSDACPHLAIKCRLAKEPALDFDSTNSSYSKYHGSWSRGIKHESTMTKVRPSSTANVRMDSSLFLRFRPGLPVDIWRKCGIKWMVNELVSLLANCRTVSLDIDPFVTKV